MVKLKTLSAAVAMVVALSGCAVGPNYQTPDHIAGTAVNVDYQQAVAAQHWWQAFDDATLNQLIDVALQENRNLVQARANVDRAYAVFRDTANDRYPNGSVDMGYQSTENSTLSPVDDGVITRGYQTGLNLSWDVDLFGKLRRATEAAEARAQHADLLWHDAQVQLIGQVATSYGEYRGAQLRLQVAEQNLQNLQQSRAIVQARLEGGMASELELAQLDVQFYQIQSAVPEYKELVLRAESTLSALLAKQPGQLQLDAITSLPELKQPVAVKAGENYLRHRADVAAAERSLAASTAAIGVATADLYPSLSVGGFLGFLSTPDLTLERETRSWSVAPNLSWQLADLGSVKARIRVAKAESQMALAQFEQQVFNAMNDMQLSVNSYNLSREQQLSTEQQWQASQRALDMARNRYDAGSGEFLSLLDAERDMLTSSDRLAQLQQQTFVRLVAIYRSFGGGIELI